MLSDADWVFDVRIEQSGSIAYPSRLFANGRRHRTND